MPLPSRFGPTGNGVQQRDSQPTGAAPASLHKRASGGGATSSRHLIAKHERSGPGPSKRAPQDAVRPVLGSGGATTGPRRPVRPPLLRFRRALTGGRDRLFGAFGVLGEFGVPTGM